MSRMKEKNYTAAVRQLFSRFGMSGGTVAPPSSNTVEAAYNSIDWAYDNGGEVRFRNAADTDDIRALSVNASNQVMVAEALASAERKSVAWQVQDNASIVSQGFFIANPGEYYRITGITWEHTTQSSVSGTAYVEKTPSGTAIGSGTSLMSGTFNLHTIANATVTQATLTTTNTGDSDNPDLILNPGDMLSVVIAGTTTSLAGVVCTVYYAPLTKSVKHATYYMNANADMVQGQYFFTANRAYGNVLAVSMRWSTKSSVAGLKLTVTKDTGTTAPGGGTSLLTDNTNAGPLVTQTANTTYAGTMSTTAATIRMAAGDRLSIEFSGATLTALVGLVVTVSIAETAAGRIEKTWFLDHVPGQADLTGLVSGTFWTADRDYEVLDLSFVQNVAAGAACKMTVTADTGTTAPGGGTVLATQNTNAGFDLNATARTVQYATLPTIENRFLLTGDRLSIKTPTGTLTTAAGAQLTVSLAPR